jgi:hypothetical protein
MRAVHRPQAQLPTLAEDLASHGYIVVGFDALRTGRVVFPDGRVMGGGTEQPDVVLPDRAGRCVSRVMTA